MLQRKRYTDSGGYDRLEATATEEALVTCTPKALATHASIETIVTRKR